MCLTGIYWKGERCEACGATVIVVCEECGERKEHDNHLSACSFFIQEEKVIREVPEFMKTKPDEAKESLTPHWTHDEPTDEFLGTFAGRDLYYSPSDYYPNVISRFGNKPNEYISGVAKAIEEPELWEAVCRALALRFPLSLPEERN